jgi:hypothetical protein
MDRDFWSIFRPNYGWISVGIYDFYQGRETVKAFPLYTVDGKLRSVPIVYSGNAFAVSRP